MVQAESHPGGTMLGEDVIMYGLTDARAYSRSHTIRDACCIISSRDMLASSLLRLVGSFFLS
jgi:hypothetical protein